MGAVVSLDGFIADEKGEVGPLFDWYANGAAEWTWSPSQDEPCRTTQASKDFAQAVYPQIGAVVIGRKLFDQTNGWSGAHSSAPWDRVRPSRWTTRPSSRGATA